MALTGFRDIQAAYDAGRHWSSWFQKNNGITLSNTWVDNAFSSGFPSYNARAGAPLVFQPAVSSGNKSIYIPPVPAGMTRHLVGIQVKSTNAGSSDMSVLFDLLGYVPGIDGDSTDAQVVDNTGGGLPRYTSGVGVQMALVSNVAPPAANGSAKVTYVDDRDQVCVTPVFNVKNSAALGTLCNGNVAAVSGTAGPLGIPLASGSRGVKRVIEVDFISAPSGQFAVYLFRPLATFITGWDNDNVSSMTLEKDLFLHNGFAAPIIYDGAWLGQFSYRNGGNSAGWVGMFDFIWG